MRPKVKLIATVASLAMAVALLSFATFAAFSDPYTFSGTINIIGNEATAEFVPITGMEKMVSFDDETNVLTFADANISDASDTIWAFGLAIKNTGGSDCYISKINWTTAPTLGFDVIVSEDSNFSNPIVNNASIDIPVAYEATVIIYVEITYTAGGGSIGEEYDFSISIYLSDSETT